MRRFPWWAWVCGAVFVLTTAWSIYTILRWGLAVATNLANIGSFVVALVALVLALVPLVSQRSRKRITPELAAHILHVDEAEASRPPRVSQLDNKQLGVRPAVESADFGMTRYVHRDIEATAIKAMRAGHMVVFTGPATAGKT